MTDSTRTEAAAVSVAGPAAYFAAALEAARRAHAAAGPAPAPVLHIRLGNRAIRLELAGPALLPALIPAIAHRLAPPSASPEWTVQVWDSASTGVSMPQPAWAPGDQGPRGEIAGFNTPRFRAVVDPEGPSASLLDTTRRLGVFWLRDAARVPYYETAAPLRAILHWVMSVSGHQCIHAGAVGTEHGGALLVGKGGSGKSTTALACLDAGLSYAGDDYCLARLDGAPCVESMYCSAKVNLDTLARFPRLAPSVSNADRLPDEKAVLLLHADRAGQIVPGFPLRAVLLPTVRGSGASRLVPVSRAAALLALAPSTLFQLPGQRRDALAALARFLEAAVCYRLELGPDTHDVPALVRAAIG